MKYILILTLLGAIFSGCVTRNEYDSYTITVRDSVIREYVRNAPGTGEENGTVYPSSRTMRQTRESLSYDSTYERHYPDFLRYGGIEIAGIITGSSNPGLGAGLLGVYTLLDSNHNPFNTLTQRTPQNSTFKGRLFRLVPVEYQLHWFNEAPDWTIGWSALEILSKDNDASNTLYSVLGNVYLRKRYWLRDRPPYIFASPFFGVSLLPSFYVNFGSELTLGSFGGFNLRAYAGLATGFATIKDVFTTGQSSRSITTPYLGFGVSALDFINKVSETQHEWKEYLHSAVEVSVIDFDLLDAFSNYPNLFKIPGTVPITGMNVQFATAHFPLDIFDGKFWTGTSLFKFFALGYNQALFSVLPLRAGYRQYLIAEDLTLEPFIEANYYPSSFVNLGARLRLNTFHDMTLGLIFGYANGSTGAFYNKVFIAQGSPIPANIASFYFGISFSPKDRLNTPELVRALEKLVTW